MTISESKGRFFYKTNRFESIRITNRIESIRIANWNALISTLHYIYKCSVVWLWCGVVCLVFGRRLALVGHHTLSRRDTCT